LNFFVLDDNYLRQIQETSFAGFYIAAYLKSESVVACAFEGLDDVDLEALRRQSLKKILRTQVVKC